MKKNELKQKGTIAFFEGSFRESFSLKKQQVKIGHLRSVGVGVGCVTPTGGPREYLNNIINVWGAKK